MLTGYFDESGHSQDPACRYVGMAGFVAPAENWEIFERDWTNLLDNAALREPFHMRDFAHSFGQFESWKDKENERRMLFGRLVQIIQATQAVPIGAAVSLDDFATLTPEQQLGFKDPYYLAFQRCTRGASTEGLFLRPEERVNMVYAFNSEFGTERGLAEQLFHFVKSGYPDAGWRLGTYTSATPNELCPLQAADLFVYELVHEFENRVKRPDDDMRWGLRRIVRMIEIPLPKIMLFDRKELLRQIQEGGFPDQTGVEEVADDQIRSAQANMMRWLIRRGEWDGEFSEFPGWDEWKHTNRGEA